MRKKESQESDTIISMHDKVAKNVKMILLPQLASRQ